MLTKNNFDAYVVSAISTGSNWKCILQGRGSQSLGHGPVPGCARLAAGSWHEPPAQSPVCPPKQAASGVTADLPGLKADGRGDLGGRKPAPHALFCSRQAAVKEKVGNHCSRKDYSWSRARSLSLDITYNTNRLQKSVHCMLLLNYQGPLGLPYTRSNIHSTDQAFNCITFSQEQRSSIPT